MRARVRREDAPRQPAAVEVARRLVDEAARVVAPVGEAREAEREPAAQAGRHRRVGVLGVAAPVQGVALAARPRGARPDDVLARRLARDVGDDLVVAQGVEVVLVPARAPRGVLAAHGCALAEVNLDGAHPHLEERRELPLIPLDRLRVRHVEHGVLERQGARLVLDRVALRDYFGVQLVLRREIRVLPEAHSETLLLQIGDHLRGVFEAGLGELVVAAPVGLEPAGVEVNHVRRDAVLAELRGHVAHLVLGLVGDAAHPEAERPERRDGAAAGELRVLGEDVFGLAEEDEDVEVLVAGVDGVVAVEGLAEVEGDGRGGVDEHAVAAAGEEERDRLVHELVLHAHAVARPGVDALPALVEAREGLAAAEDFFVVLKLERRRRHAREV